MHPVPSLLDAAVTAAIAAVAGGRPPVIGGLAAGMLALQFSIGAVNDVADRNRDRLGRGSPGDAGGGERRMRDLLYGTKPIASGLIAPSRATALAVVFAIVGLGASAYVGFGPLAVAALGLATGLAYDLRLKGTPWSWLPFAGGVGLLPVYAWLGATGELPAAFLFVVPLAVGAGASLAIANAVVDYGADLGAGTRSIATSVGRNRALAAGGATLAAVDGILVGTFVRYPPSPVAAFLAAGGVVLGWLGVAMTVRPPALRRQIGWEMQAVGLALLGLGWVGTLAAAGLLPAAR